MTSTMARSRGSVMIGRSVHKGYRMRAMLGDERGKIYHGRRGKVIRVMEDRCVQRILVVFSASFLFANLLMWSSLSQ